MAGTNDVLDVRERLPQPSDFCHQVNASTIKLRKLSEKLANSTFVLDPPPLPMIVLTPHQQTKLTDIKRCLGKLVLKSNQFHYHELDPDRIEREKGLHPTLAGTCSILQQLHIAKFQERLIIDEEFCVQKNWY